MAHDAGENNYSRDQNQSEKLPELKHGKLLFKWWGSSEVRATTHKGACKYQGDNWNEGSETVISHMNPW